MTTLCCITLHCYAFLFSLPTNGNTIEVIDTVPERSAEVKSIVAFYLTHFKIENQKVVIFMSPSMPYQYKAYLVAAFWDKQGKLGFTQINVDNKLKGYCLAKVIGHEIYHIKQMVENRLYFEDNRSVVKWNGKIFKNSERIPFEKRPWERECLQQEFAFAHAYSKHRKKTLKQEGWKEQEKRVIVGTKGQTIPVYSPQPANTGNNKNSTESF